MEGAAPALAGRNDGDSVVRGTLAYSQLIRRVWHLLHRGQRWSQRRFPRAQAWQARRRVIGLEADRSIIRTR